MDRIHIADFSNTDDLGNQQVTLCGSCRPDTNSLIRQLYRQTVFIRFGIHHHGLNTQLLTGTDDPEGDFAAVGN